MHAILYGLKRAYWGSIGRARKPLHVHQPGLTPARFDLMHAIQQERPVGAILQSKLRKILGVCRQVVIRMVDSLVALGWLERTRCALDKRTYVVALTKAGTQVIDFAYYRFVRSVRAKRWVNQGLIGMDPWPDLDLAFAATLAFDDRLTMLRKVWNAGGTLHYPWHPDD